MPGTSRPSSPSAGRLGGVDLPFSGLAFPEVGIHGGAGAPPLRPGAGEKPARQHPRQPWPGAVTTLKEYFVKGANKQKVINVKSLSPESCAVKRKNSSDGMRFLNGKRERTPNPFHEDLPEP